MNMYEAILKRKSIRNYDMNPIDLETIKEIEEYIKTIQTFNTDIKTNIYVLTDDKKVSGLFKVKAPHYVVIDSEKKEDYLVNVGYILEQLVIYLTTKGIGTCWLGSTKPVVKNDKNSSLNFVSMIAFGTPNETMYRESTNEFKRKDITQISNLFEEDSIMEAVRLAPSAVNRQSWFFEVFENEISVYRQIVAVLTEKMTKVDIGIAIAHIVISAQNEGKTVEFIKKENKMKKGYDYVITCKIV